MENDKAYSVSVLSGAHVGAAIALAPGKYDIGRSFDADIVLQESRLKPFHLRLELAGEEATLSCLDGAVSVHGASDLRAKGQAQSLNFPLDLSLDDVHLRVDGPEPSRKHPGAWSFGGIGSFGRHWRSSALVMLAILPISIYAIAATATPTATTDQPSEDVLAMSSGSGKVGPSADIIDMVRDKANSAGLAGLLEIDRAGDAISVRGKLKSAQMAHWLDIRRDIDTSYGSAYAFDSQIETVAAIDRPHLELQAIWAGPQANVITSTGERLSEGSLVPGGWYIDKIEAKQVTLTEGTQKVILTY